MTLKRRLAVCLACFGAIVPIAEAQRSTDTWRRLLRQQGFQYFDQLQKGDQVSLADEGPFLCGKRRLELLRYQWNGVNGHGIMRLIFFHGERYLGHYAVQETRLSIRGGVISFPYDKKLGNSLTCSGDQLPRTVVLDGELTTLER